MEYYRDALFYRGIRFPCSERVSKSRSFREKVVKSVEPTKGFWPFGTIKARDVIERFGRKYAPVCPFVASRYVCDPEDWLVVGRKVYYAVAPTVYLATREKFVQVIPPKGFIYSEDELREQFPLYYISMKDVHKKRDQKTLSGSIQVGLRKKPITTIQGTPVLVQIHRTKLKPVRHFIAHSENIENEPQCLMVRHRIERFRVKTFVQQDVILSPCVVEKRDIIKRVPIKIVFSEHYIRPARQFALPCKASLSRAKDVVKDETTPEVIPVIEAVDGKKITRRFPHFKPRKRASKKKRILPLVKRLNKACLVWIIKVLTVSIGCHVKMKGMKHRDRFHTLLGIQWRVFDKGKA
jgi:hypothetical protein